MRLNICNFIRRGADLSNNILTKRCRLLITSNIFIPYYRFHLYYQSSMSSSTLRTFTSTSSMSDENRRRQKIYDDIKETSITVPNALCLARIALSPIIGIFVINEHFAVALSLFVVAGATDLLDGFIARRYPSQQSLLGSVLDPLADKALVSVLFLTLTYVQLIPLPLTIVIILRDLCLVTGGLWKRYQELAPPKTLSRYFDPSVSKMQVMPTTISKMNTALQLALVAASLASPVFGFVDHYSLQILCWTTAATTVASGLHYIRVNSMQRVDRWSNKKQQ